MVIIDKIMDISEDIKAFVEERIPEIVKIVDKSRESFRFRCPICMDSRKSKNKSRGNYYRQTCTYYCFNCGATLSGLFIVAEFEGISINDVKRDYFQQLISDNIKNTNTISIKPQDIEHERKSIEIPDNWVDIPKDLLKRFILDRKILDAKGAPDKWRFHYNIKNDRIVIPWIYNNEVVYYQERNTKKYGEKYLFPKNLKKSIFGLDNLDDNIKYIYYTEGCFDSIFIPNGVAIGGCFPTNQQLDLINNIKFDKKLVWFPDNPWIDKTARKKIIKYADRFPNYNIYMWSKNIDSKDVNELLLKIKDIDFFFNNPDELKNNIISLSKAKIMLHFNQDVL